MKRILGFATLAVLLLACPKDTGGQGNAANAQARAELDAAKQKAATGDASAQADLQRLQSQYANTDVAADALFEDAELAFRKKDFAGAREKYRALLEKNPTYAKADAAKLHLGESDLELGDGADALQTLEPIYDHAPADQKAELGPKLAKAAVAAHAWGSAVRFLAEGGEGLTDPAAKQKLDQQLHDLVDGQVPQLEVAKLANALKPTSPAYAMVLFKLARIDFHLHDWDALKQTLTTLQQNAPNNPYSADAQKLLDRASRREQVKPNALGVLLPLSGKWQRLGESALAGIKLGVAGSGLQLVVKDTAGDPDKAKKLVQELVLDDGVIAIVGPIISTEAQAAAIDADELGVPIITLSRDEALTDRGPYVFRDMLTNSAQARALVDYATRIRGFTTFGVLYPTIPYGTELANDFWDDVLAAGGEVHAVESYDHDQTTFGPPVQKLVGRYFKTDRYEYLQAAHEINEAGAGAYKSKQAFEKLKKNLPPVVDFEALFIPDTAKNVGLVAPAIAAEDVITNGCDTKDIENIAKTMGVKPRDVKTVVLLGANAWDAPELVDRGGKFVHCSVFVDGFYAGSARPATKHFVQEFSDQVGKPPDLLSAYGFDAGAVVKQLATHDKPQTRDAFRDALMRVKGVTGASGPLTVTNKNEIEHPLYFLTIDRNGMKELDVAAEAEKADKG